MPQENLNFVPTFPGGTEGNPDKMRIGNIWADIRSFHLYSASVGLRHYGYTKVCSVQLLNFLLPLPIAVIGQSNHTFGYFK